MKIKENSPFQEILLKEGINNGKTLIHFKKRKRERFQLFTLPFFFFV